MEIPTGLLGDTEHMKKRLRKTFQRITCLGGDLAAILTSITLATPTPLSLGHRPMSLISPSLNPTVVMHITLLGDNTLVQFAMNSALIGRLIRRQIGDTIGAVFAQIPRIIHQVQRSTLLTEATLATCLRHLLLPLVVGIRLPVSCSTVRIPRRGLM